MNRYGTTAAALGLLLLLGACGGSEKPAAASNQAPAIPSTPTVSAAPTSTPTPKPADPTAAARTKVLSDYANFFAVVAKGFRYGGVSYPYEQVLIDPALESTKGTASFVKGIRGGKVTGTSQLLESRISTIDLTAKPPTATVTACMVDNLKAVDKKGKVIFSPPGKITRQDKLKLVKGRWMVYSLDTGDKSYGCTK